MERGTRMLYRLGGMFSHEGEDYDYLIVPDGDEAEYLPDGWFMTTAEAKASSLPDRTEEVRAEVNAARAELRAAELSAGVYRITDTIQVGRNREALEAEATRLGIKFDGRTSDLSLERKIKAAGDGLAQA